MTGHGCYNMPLWASRSCVELWKLPRGSDGGCCVKCCACWKFSCETEVGVLVDLATWFSLFLLSEYCLLSRLRGSRLKELFYSQVATDC